VRIRSGIGAWLLFVVTAAIPVWPGQPEIEKRSAEKKEMPKAGGKEITNSIGMKLVYIPPGKFVMGTPKAEIDHLKKEHKENRFDNEGPQHEVEISKGFYLGKYEVTQGEYLAVMEKNPSWFSAEGGGKKLVEGKDTSRFPVEQVSWDDAKEFCRKLTERERKAGKLGQSEEYRLPSEAEWEYACRGRVNKYQAFHYGDSLASRQANINEGSALQRTTAVGEYKENPFGLYDMHGNVSEWCEDRFNEKEYQRGECKDPKGPMKGGSRVVRGGSWSEEAKYCRSGFRLRFGSSGWNDYLGFRVVRSFVE
jgi:formylglycine-generating enzyme required for sulfatase activity